MTTLRNALAALLLAIAGWLAVPSAPAIDAERARCDAVNHTIIPVDMETPGPEAPA